jgi:molybdate transport system regulatory protein
MIAPAWHLLQSDGRSLGGDHLELLRQIGATGSMREAAAVCGISYRTAWSRVGELNRASDAPLVLSVNGGAKGGESVLTESGKQLVETHERANRSFRAALDLGGIDPAHVDSWIRFLRRISMKTSARNQLSGTVTAIRKGAVNAEIELSLPGGASVVSQITLPSLSSLDLKVGSEVWALVKASWVILAVGEDEPKVSARNRLKGKVVVVAAGAVNTEVELEIAGGHRIVATVTNGSVKSLGLAKGATAWALFKAGSVILGTLG